MAHCEYRFPMYCRLLSCLERLPRRFHFALLGAPIPYAVNRTQSCDGGDSAPTAQRRSGLFRCPERPRFSRSRPDRVAAKMKARVSVAERNQQISLQSSTELGWAGLKCQVQVIGRGEVVSEMTGSRLSSSVKKVRRKVKSYDAQLL